MNFKDHLRGLEKLRDSTRSSHVESHTRKKYSQGSSIKGEMKALASKGRYGDSRLAEIGPRTSKVLDKVIHEGHREINPRTGLREYPPKRRPDFEYDRGENMFQGKKVPFPVQSLHPEVDRGWNGAWETEHSKRRVPLPSVSESEEDMPSLTSRSRSRSRSRSPSQEREESPISKYMSNDFYSNHYHTLPDVLPSGQSMDDYIASKTGLSMSDRSSNEKVSRNTVLFANKLGEKALKEHIKHPRTQNFLGQPGDYDIPLKSTQGKIYEGATSGKMGVSRNTGSFTMPVSSIRKPGDPFRSIQHSTGFRGGESDSVPYKFEKKPMSTLPVLTEEQQREYEDRLTRKIAIKKANDEAIRKHTSYG